MTELSFLGELLFSFCTWEVVSIETPFTLSPVTMHCIQTCDSSHYFLGQVKSAQATVCVMCQVESSPELKRGCHDLFNNDITGHFMQLVQKERR